MTNIPMGIYYIIETPLFSIPFPELFIKSVDADIHFLKKISYSSYYFHDGFYPKGAGQSHRIGFIAAHSRYSYTAS
jgi:hypothetical protein